MRSLGHTNEDDYIILDGMIKRGEGVCEYWERNRFRVVCFYWCILDWQLPAISGLTGFDAIRTQSHKTFFTILNPPASPSVPFLSIRQTLWSLQAVVGLKGR